VQTTSDQQGPYTLSISTQLAASAVMKPMIKPGVITHCCWQRDVYAVSVDRAQAHRPCPLSRGGASTDSAARASPTKGLVASGSHHSCLRGPPPTSVCTRYTIFQHSACFPTCQIIIKLAAVITRCCWQRDVHAVGVDRAQAHRACALSWGGASADCAAGASPAEHEACLSEFRPPRTSKGTIHYQSARSLLLLQL
jgi:hypothetical protein